MTIDSVVDKCAMTDLQASLRFVVGRILHGNDLTGYGFRLSESLILPNRVIFERSNDTFETKQIGPDSYKILAVYSFSGAD